MSEMTPEFEPEFLTAGEIAYEAMRAACELEEQERAARFIVSREVET